MADRILWSRMRSVETVDDTSDGIRSFRGGGLRGGGFARRSSGFGGRTVRADAYGATASYAAKPGSAAGATGRSAKPGVFSAAATGQSATGTRRAGNASSGTRRAGKGASGTRPREHSGDGSTRRIHVMRKLVLGLIVAVAAIVAGEVTFQTVLAPNLAIRQIRLRGDSVVSESDLLDIAGLSGTMLYFHVDSDAIAARLETIPEVSEAAVSTDFPDTLTIDIAARRPLAVTHLSEDGQSVPALIDREGVVFRTGLRASEYDLPVISGLRLERFEPGDTLPEELTRLFVDLGRLRMDEPALFSAVSEIRVVRRAGQYETVMYPTFASVPVRMPARVEPDRYEAAVHAIDALERRGEIGSVGEIDMRSGDVVYTTDAED